MKTRFQFETAPRTEGPLKIRGPLRAGNLGADESTFEEVGFGIQQAEPAKFGGGTIIVKDGLTKADATLFAAAPEVLEALVGCVSRLEREAGDMNATPTSDPELWRWIDQGNDAIRQADGANAISATSRLASALLALLDWTPEASSTGRYQEIRDEARAALKSVGVVSPVRAAKR